MADVSPKLDQLPADDPNVRKVKRAVGVAALNAWSFAVFAAASAVLLVLATLEGGFTIAAAGITIALFVVSYYEFRGQRMLTELNPDGCRLLGWNQLGLLAALTAYCAWSIVWGFLYPSPLSDILTEHPEILEPYDEMQRRDIRVIFEILGDYWPALIASIYGGVIFGTLIYQGGNAWYYFARQEHVEQCLQAHSEIEVASEANVSITANGEP